VHPQINLKDFKLVVSDLDGTIKDSEQPIHPETINTFTKLNDIGIFFTLASGRSLASLRPYAEELQIRIPLVLANGCIIQSMDGKIHHREFMPPEVTRKLFEITDREKSDMVIFVDDHLYFKKMTTNIDRIFGRIRDDITEIGKWEQLENLIDSVNKFMILDWENLDRLDRLEELFSQELDGKAEYLRTNIHHLEVMPKGVSKATGLEYLCKELGITMGEILAFGDFDNDTEMLKAVGFGAAVANATDRTKANADLIIGSCAENGPAVFLNDLIQRHA
jgi:hypothetical protein